MTIFVSIIANLQNQLSTIFLKMFNIFSNRTEGEINTLFDNIYTGKFRESSKLVNRTIDTTKFGSTAYSRITNKIKLSTELEQLRVNRTFEDSYGSDKQDFWNTALFLGAGYRNENITIGIRYNILHKDRDNIYTELFMPFVRVYF